MTSDLAGARGGLETAAGPVDIYRLGWLADRGIGDIAALPAHRADPPREPPAPRGHARRERRGRGRPGGLAGPAADVAFMPGRVLMQDFTGVPAVVDLAAMRSAMAREGGDPARVNPLDPGRPRDRPQRPGGSVPHARGVRAQHRVRVPAQRRAVRPAALGTAGLRRAARRAAGRRHLPSGEPRAPRAGRGGPRRRGLPRHPGGHRFPHHDGERPRRPGLGRRRDRGRGRDAGPADVPAPTGGGGRARHRRVARRHHGNRPRPHAHGDAPCPRRGGPVRRVLRRRALLAHHRRSRHAVQHVSRIRRDGRLTSRWTRRPCGT